MIGALSFQFNYFESDISSFTLSLENETFEGTGFVQLLYIFERFKEENIIFVKNLPIFYVLSRNFICYDDGNGAYTKDKGINIFWIKVNNVELRNWDNFIPAGFDKIQTPKQFLTYINGIHNLYGTQIKNYKWTLARIVKTWLTKTFFLKMEQDFIEDCIPNEGEYEIYKSLTKGGFYWTNPKFFGKTIQNVNQFDAKTNHASQMARKLFPKRSLERIDENKLMTIWKDEKWCWAAEFSFSSFEVKKDLGIDLKEWGAIYDREQKRWHLNVINPLVEVLFKTFKFEDFKIENAFAAEAGYLPNDYYRMIKRLFETKEDSKGINKTLAKFQTELIYGQSIKKPEHLWETSFEEEENDFVKHYCPLSFSEIQKKIKKNLLPFQVGIWTLAYSNADLINLVLKIGMDNVVYCDTDCVKFIGEKGLEVIKEHNEKIDKEFEKIYKEKQIDFGKKLGRWADEGLATKFKSIGVKWYIEEVKGEIEIKAAGADKNKIRKVLEEKGDMFENFSKDLEKQQIFKTIYYNKAKGWIENKNDLIANKNKAWLEMKIKEN